MNDLIKHLSWRYLTMHRTQFMVALATPTIYGINYIWGYYGPTHDNVDMDLL